MQGRDLTGQRFGRLVALRPTDERKNGSILWECQCDCGNTVFVKSANLVNQRTQSCGCLRREMPRQHKDLTGQRFGRLVALRPTEKRSNGSVMWECQCDCGNNTVVQESRLMHGGTKSCGCLRSETRRRYNDLTGQRFGKLVVLRPKEQRKGSSIVWECQCDCGNTAAVVSGNLVNGSTKSCGCIKTNKDITGHRFGKLVALRPTERRKNGNVMWECQCDCGNIAFVRSAYLVNGNTKSCGCLRKEKIGKSVKNLTGQRFGKLIALHPTAERKSRSVMWECQCDCGNITFVSSTNLVNGHTGSCGCMRKRPKQEKKYKDLTGQRFGKLVALRPTDERKNGSVMWECQCDCGNTTVVRRASLVNGSTQSCGCKKHKQNQINNN